MLYLTTLKAACNALITDHDHYRTTSAYSPILDRFEFQKITTQINGSLYDGHPPSLLRDPGKAGDGEWFRIGTGIFPIVVSSGEILKLGKDPDLAVKIPEEHGYGSGAFIAQTDAFHRLHCVDMLRRDIIHPWDQCVPNQKHSSDVQHWAHIGHCLDFLAQAISCTALTDLILFNWVDGWDQPFPDFGTKKVCEEFDALLSWVNNNSIPHEVFQAMKEPPPGYVRLPEPAPVVSS